METQSEESLVPRIQSRRWSPIALAALIALDSFRAEMTAAPRVCTVCHPRERENKWVNGTLSLADGHLCEDGRIVVVANVLEHLTGIQDAAVGTTHLHMRQIRILRVGVVAPDDCPTHGVNGDAKLPGKKTACSVVVETREGGEVGLGDGRGVVGDDECVRVGGIPNDEHLEKRRHC